MRTFRINKSNLSRPRQIYQIHQMSLWQLPTVARQGLKFLFKNFFKPPIYPQVAIKFVLKNVQWWGSHNILQQMIILLLWRTLLRHTIPTGAYWVVTCVMGVAYKIYLWIRIFLRCICADLDFICSDLILSEFKQMGLMGCLILNAAINCYGVVTDMITYRMWGWGSSTTLAIR